MNTPPTRGADATMISYAQNREDVLLRRAFPHATGFYVDIGAADPVAHSVTKHFSDAGWTGINVEPVEEFYRRLVSDRPRDVNLNLAVAERAGEIVLHEVPASIGMATVDPETTDRHRADGLALAPRTVPAMTLAQLCRDHVRTEIDFLKIDVEGAERAVLAGADFATWRPKVLVIEATEAGRSTPNHETWEPLVLAADYEFATFDGLNRYYVRAESRELAAAFAVPVNVFDDYVVADTVRERDARRDAETLLAALKVERAALETNVATARVERTAIEGELATARDERQAFEGELATARGERQAIEGVLKAARDELATVDGEWAADRQSLCERTAELDALRRKYAEGRAAFEIAIRILERTRSHLDVLRGETLRYAA